MTLNREEIKKSFSDLTNEEQTPQKRGFALEKILSSILTNEGLDPRTGYKPTGEQIDGSFFWEGRTFLLEAKWVNSPTPASSIYAFKGKLDGKFHTTSGIFISINGYSEEAEDALKFGKTLNIILFDGSDIRVICDGKVSFIEVLKFKLRQAGDTGSLLVPFEIKAQTETIAFKSPEINQTFEGLTSQPEITSRNKPLKRVDDLLIFVEGKSDVRYVSNFLKPLSKEYFLSYKIEVLQGGHNIRRIPSILNLYRKAKAVIVLLDDDLVSQSLRGLTENISDQIDNSLTPVPIKFFFIDKELRETFASNVKSLVQLRKLNSFNSIEKFIRSIAEDYYDPEIDIPRENLVKEMKNLHWNYEKGVVEYDDEYSCRIIELGSIEEIVDHLEERIVQAMDGEMPLEWLKSQDFPDYSTEVKEYLSRHCKNKIRKMGWDENEL